ncbi:LamB/YcsF family protein [Desulforapulum autotrophicum]|nr:5-oxoprolinase subunit PxpA [Desulforapulum autotrophicum]
MTGTMDLNCDMGESFGTYTIGMDEAVMPLITSANIACGFHGGDPWVMEKTVILAKVNKVNIGAHPGYPDLEGFGRRKMELSPKELRSTMIYQIGALRAFAAAHGTRVTHVKPHGSLYLKAVEDPETAETIARAILDVDPEMAYIALAGKKGKNMERLARTLGLKVIFEAFPDRAYTPEGTLAPRSMAGAVISDPHTVAQRALMMAEEGAITAIDGSRIKLEAQTLCIHGDNQGAVDLIKGIRTTLGTRGILLAPALG